MCDEWKKRKDTGFPCPEYLTENVVTVNKYGRLVIECNKCYSLFTRNGNYCPNCGADIRKEVKS